MLNLPCNRRLLGLSCLVLCTALIGGCRPQAAAPALHFDVAVEPSPPKVGDASVSVVVSNVAGKPVHGAKIRVEGNMNHAGMKPSFADLNEQQTPGQYSGTLRFTMAGDWFLLISVTTSDGAKIEHKFDVPGVQPK